MKHRARDLSDTLELMSRVATLYYVEDHTQAQVAQKLGLQRSRVVRLLKRAQEEGIVEITIHPHPGLNLSLEAEFKERFGLQEVLLASDQHDEVVQRSQVAQMVAHYLMRSLQDNMVVAVGMGRNIGAIPSYLANVAPRACRFISALGGSPEIDSVTNPDDVARRLAESFGGTSESLYAPAYVESPTIRDLFMSHETIQHTLQKARQADIALVGIGDAYDRSAVVQIGCFTSGEMRVLRQAGAVGDILGLFFNIHGRPVAGGMEHRVVGLSAEDLHRIPNVLAVASEKEKVQAILGALRTGLVQVMATSTHNAREILQLDKERERDV
jgi:DNA-binding transcriptional regulator LsrR (DeoR family)